MSARRLGRVAWVVAAPLLLMGVREPGGLGTSSGGDTLTASYQVSGVRVIQRVNPATDVVAEAIREGWQTIKRPLHALVGIRNDKDWRAMLASLRPLLDRLTLTVPPSIPLMQRWSIEDMGPDVAFEPDFERALHDIQDGAATVLVTGSFHTVGDAMARLPGFAPVG